MYALMARGSRTSSRSQLSVYVASDLFRRFQQAARQTGSGHQQTLVAIALERLLASMDRKAMIEAIADYEIEQERLAESESEKEAKPSVPAQEPRSPAEPRTRLGARRA